MTHPGPADPAQAEKQTSQTVGWLILSLAPLFWSGNIVVARAMAETIPPIGLSFWRWAVAAMIICPFVLPRLRSQWPVIRRELRYLVALGTFGCALFPILMYGGLHTTTAINAGFIQALCPVMIPLFAWMMYGSVIGWRHGAGILISCLGALAIISAGDPLALIANGGTIGDLMVLAATTLWSIYSVIVVRRSEDLDPIVVIFATMVIGVVMLLPLWIGEVVIVGGVPVTQTSILAIGYIAVFPSVGAYFCFNRGLEIVGPSRGGLSMHLLPMFTALLAVGLLGEAFRIYHAVGIGLIFAGLIVVAGAKRA